MFLTFLRGQTSIVLRVKLRSPTSPFDGVTGLTNATTGLVIASIADNAATGQNLSGANISGTITTLGTYQTPSAGTCRFKEVDATNHPGIYEIHLEDSRFAISNAKSLIVSIKTTSACLQTNVQITLADVNPFAGTNFGLSALPTSAPATNGGLFLSGSSGKLPSGAIGTDAFATGSILASSFSPTAGSFVHLGIIDQGFAQSATSTTLVLRSAASFASSEIIGSRILISAATTGAGQSRVITAYDGATDTATVDAWTTTPTGTIEYKIFSDTNVAAAVMAATGDTSISLTKVLEMVAAFVAGKISVSSSGGVSTYTYKKRDGTTTSFTSLCSETDGTRATTGNLS